MTTLLKKDIKRETIAVTDFRNNKLIVILKAGDMLEFKIKRKKYGYIVPLAACFNLAMIYTAKERYDEKLKKYEEGKKIGRKMKKPKLLPKIFNEKLYQALKLI